MKTTRIKERLIEENPEAVLIGGLDKALLGIHRNDLYNPVGVYSFLKTIEVLMEKGLTEEEALAIYEKREELVQTEENLPLWIDDTGV